jgi:hypothetical protein
MRKKCEKFEAKRSEKKRKKRSETHVKRIQIRFISLISEKKNFKRNGRTLHVRLIPSLQSLLLELRELLHISLS